MHAYSKYNGSSNIDSKNQPSTWFMFLFNHKTCERNMPKYPSIDGPLTLLNDSKVTLVLTMEGRSQHLSRLIQLKLQIISNIWSWNYTTEEEENMVGCYKWLPILMKMHNVWKQSNESLRETERRRASILTAVTGSSSNLIVHLRTRGLGYSFFGKVALPSVLFQTFFTSFFFRLLSQTASFRLQTWPTCRALRNRPVWGCWPPWWASLPPPGNPRWAWLCPRRCWCGAAGEGWREGTINKTLLSSQYLSSCQLYCNTISWQRVVRTLELLKSWVWHFYLERAWLPF